MNHVDKVFSFTSKIKFYGASFPGRKEGVCSKSVRNVGTSSTVFATTLTERTTRKLRIGRIRREFSCNYKVTKVRGALLQQLILGPLKCDFQRFHGQFEVV